MTIASVPINSSVFWGCIYNIKGGKIEEKDEVLNLVKLLDVICLLMDMSNYKGNCRAIMSNEEEKRCPLCAEEMDWTDLQFKPCQYGYQNEREARQASDEGGKRL